jgi:hypothetical protein
MSTTTLPTSVSRTELKQVGRYLAVLLLYAVAFFIALLGFAALGRRGTIGSLILACLTVGLLMTVIHYGLKSRGW